jgi:hypothetical protein
MEIPMASQPPTNLPVMYNDLLPLSSTVHGAFHSRSSDKAPFFAKIHAVPLTADEFIHAQRYTPIVFASGDSPVPLALFGLNEGINTFVDDEGSPHNPFYVPAYVRRYPYMLARLRPDSQELSLCYDPTTDLVGAFDEGEALFADEKPTDYLNNILKFCEDFEVAGQRTAAFVNELKALDLLIDGEVSIQPEGSEQPFVYRGFQMVSEEKFRDLHGDQLRKLNQNGILALIMAHLFSLSLIRDVFGRQMSQGKIPAAPIPVDA